MDQAVLMVQQPTARSATLFTSDSAIENCNRIFGVKNDKNDASSVWGVGKEAGYSHPGREDLVINSLCALSNSDGCKEKTTRGENKAVVDENN